MSSSNSLSSPIFEHQRRYFLFIQKIMIAVETYTIEENYFAEGFRKESSEKRIANFTYYYSVRSASMD